MAMGRPKGELVLTQAEQLQLQSIAPRARFRRRWWRERAWCSPAPAARPTGRWPSAYA